MDDKTKKTAQGAASGAAVGTSIAPGIGTLIGAGVGALANFGISAFNNHQQRKNAEYSVELANKQSAWQATHMPGLTKQGLINAGISPAVMYEGQYNTASNQNIPSSPVPSVDGVAMLSAALQAQNVAQQNKNLQTANQSAILDNEKKKLDLKVQRDLIKAWQDGTAISYFEDENGNRIYEGSNEFDDFFKRNPNALPEIVKIPGRMSRDAFLVQQEIENAKRVISDSSVQVTKNELENQVVQMQMDDKDVLKALKMMPYEQYRNLQNSASKMFKDIQISEENLKLLKNDVSNIDLMNQMLDLQVKWLSDNYQSAKNTDVGRLINDLEEDGFSFKTIAKLMLAVVMAKLNVAPIQLQDRR